jgi:hypothetical protein
MLYTDCALLDFWPFHRALFGCVENLWSLQLNDKCLIISNVEIMEQVDTFRCCPIDQTASPLKTVHPLA